MTGTPRLPPPSYAGIADLVHLDDLPVPTPRTKTAAVPAARESLGHRVTRRFFTVCEHPRTRARAMRLLRSSADSAVGGRMLVAFWSRMVFRPLLRVRRLDLATARIELVCAQLGGVAVLRYVTRMEPVASMSVDDLVTTLGPAVDATLTAAYPGPGSP